MVGTLIFTMLFPIIEAFGFFALRAVMRCLDRGWTSDPYATKSTSIQAYINSYAGPDHFMHFKYVHLMVIVFVTMMYGLAIPILFPIAALAISVLYTVEKSMLFYAYRLPPMYDERLSQSVLNQLYYAPLFMLSFGYWMASNKQLLSNEHLASKERMSDPDITEHTIVGEIMGGFKDGPAWPLLILFIILLVNLIFGSKVMQALYTCFPNLEIGDIVLDEDIDNYWVSLDDKDRKWAVEEDQYSSDMLGIQILTNKQKQALEGSESKR